MPEALSSTPTPKVIPNLNDAMTRAEYTPVAVEAFVNLVEIWRLTAGQAAALLGEGSSRMWFRIKAGERSEPLSQDALTRVSALTGVYKGLHLLFSDPLADDWIRRDNSESLFGGRSPIQFMIQGGIPAMIAARGYIDSLRGGL